ncbi:MAG TPA: DUF1203 domain-containing protein [Pyrinomonadaceae bacterium]|jgi:hypothetical protein|nr:DUF1203 domain-containing protein [Pyrinomonadaceae bacterium]
MNAMNAAKQQVTFQITPIPDEIARQVRGTGVSSWAKLPASTSIAKGYGPCRSCLRVFEVDKDERTFFTYNPFEGRAELPLPGPIFIHREECEPYRAEGFPPDLRDLPMLFEAFTAGGEMIGRVKVSQSDIEQQIGELFALPETEYIYVRNAEAGCFMAFIDRNGESR